MSTVEIAMNAAAIGLWFIAALLSLYSGESLKQKKKKKSWLNDENKFRYDIECRWLRKEEREVRISEGRCPPYPTTTEAPPTTSKRSWLPPWLKQRMKKKKKKPMFSARAKRALMSIFSFGGMQMVNIDLNDKHLSYELLTGISLSLHCNEAVRKTWKNDTESVITWYANSEVVENKKLDWRVTVSSEGILNIWPLLEEDAGTYECAVDGGIMGSAVLHVESKSEAVVRGIYNYLYVALFYIPIAVYALVLVSRDVVSPPKKSKREDRMTAFLENHVLKNGQDVKENIAKIVYGDRFEERKDEITKTMAAGAGPNGEKVRGNHETVMTVLHAPKARGQGEKRKKKAVDKKGAEGSGELTYQSVMPKVDPSRLENQDFRNEFRHWIR
ncbi:hypothetical protein Q1695_006269 [Nippostrongylus brasiliensis]|nr:hypothetical protein Q1695_006269 [Nippostrongylus brasiliensis]